MALIVIPVNISLCDVTFKLAKEKENFSEWVRHQLLSNELMRQQLLNEIRGIREDSSQPIDLEKLFDNRFRKGKPYYPPAKPNDERYRKGES